MRTKQDLDSGYRSFPWAWFVKCKFLFAGRMAQFSKSNMRPNFPVNYIAIFSYSEFGLPCHTCWRARSEAKNGALVLWFMWKDHNYKAASNWIDGANLSAYLMKQKPKILLIANPYRLLCSILIELFGWQQGEFSRWTAQRLLSRVYSNPLPWNSISNCAKTKYMIQEIWWRFPDAGCGATRRKPKPK